MFSTTRHVRVPAAGALALALVVAAAGPGHAAAANAACPTYAVTGGTSTLYMTRSYIAYMAAHDIVMAPLGAQSTSSTPTLTVTVYGVSGGIIDPCAKSGTVQYSGGTLVTNTVTGKQLVVTDVSFDIAHRTLDYVVTDASGTSVVPGLDIAGAQSWALHGRTATYTASEVFVDRAGGEAMDEYLGTDAFLDESLFGAFATTFTVG